MSAAVKMSGGGEAREKGMGIGVLVVLTQTLEIGFKRSRNEIFLQRIKIFETKIKIKSAHTGYHRQCIKDQSKLRTK